MKHLLLITLFLNIFIATSQAQGIGFFIEEDSVILNLKYHKKDTERIRKETINIKVRIENNTDSVIIFNKQTDINNIGSVRGEIEPDFCETTDYWDIFRKFMFTEDNEPIQNIFYLPWDYIYYTKSGKLKYVPGGGEPSFKTNRALKGKLKQLARHNQTSLAPNESLTYNVNVYMGDYRLQKDKVYYLMLAYNNKSVDGLSKICLVSNRLKVVTK